MIELLLEDIRMLGTPGQVRPKGGYWLPKEFYEWPEIRAVPLGALGAFVARGIWSHEYAGAEISRNGLKETRRRGVDVGPLFAAGLWLPGIESGSAQPRSIAELRAGRGRPGRVLRLSRLLPQGTEASRAGFAAFGLYALAASWSLTTDIPGYIPTAAALSFGKEKHVAALWDAGLWSATEHGFLMHQGGGFERRWELYRDDERADIPPGLRQSVYDRDGWKCVKCQSTENLTLDHVLAWSRGGPDTYENLRTLCRSCNSAKGARVE